MMKKLLVAGLIIASMAAVPTTADGADECDGPNSYESGSDAREILFERPEVPVLGDCALDVPGMVWNGCLHDDEHRALPCATTLPDDISIGIWDELFGSDVGGFVCTDADDDLLCGGAGELGIGFCGSITLEDLVDTNSIYHLAVFIDGPINQGIDCPATANPVGGTTGTVSLSVDAV